jgi:hypothetical protein
MVHASQDVQAGGIGRGNHPVEVIPVDAVLAARLDAAPRHGHFQPAKAGLLGQIDVARRRVGVAEEKDARAVIRAAGLSLRQVAGRHHGRQQHDQCHNREEPVQPTNLHIGCFEYAT